MESRTESNNVGGEGNSRFLANCREQLCSALDRLRGTAVGFTGKLAKIAREDPRRVVHSLKVGLALTLVSVLYYITPLFNGRGWRNSTIWAVITVVFVMEFTVGATLSKGLNRALATLVACFLAVGAHLLAQLCGEKGEPILLGAFVFLVASAATFSRSIPEVKARYDYGVIIFILSFSLVAVSSYRVDNLMEFTLQRVTTIAAGVAICLVTTVFVFPIWAGDDLHKLLAGNLDKLAEFLEGMASECFGENTPCENLEGKAFLRVYKSVLNSKVREESLCNFAKWEPMHGKFHCRYLWSQYQKVGTLCRNVLLQWRLLLPVWSPYKGLSQSRDMPENIRATCRAMSLRSAKDLKGLSLAIRTMTIPYRTNEIPTNSDMSTATKATSDLRTKLSEDVAYQVIHVHTVASLLSDIVIQIERIVESTSNLAQLARFKNPESARSATVINIVE